MLLNKKKTMFESSKVKAKAPKNEQSKQISIWWILIVLVIIALVFSIVAVVIALYYTNVQLKDYAQKDMFNNYATKNDLDSYVKSADFNDQCDAWAKDSDKVAKYGDSVQLQSTGTAGQTGFLTNLQSGNAQFTDCKALPPSEDGDTLNFLLYKDLSGCSYS